MTAYTIQRREMLLIKAISLEDCYGLYFSSAEGLCCVLNRANNNTHKMVSQLFGLLLRLLFSVSFLAFIHQKPDLCHKLNTLHESSPLNCQ